MPKRRPPTRSKITRLRAQTKALRWVNGVALCLFATSVGAIAVASALPQKQELEKKEDALRKILVLEEQVMAQKIDAKATEEALRDDPEYLELHAIDRLNLHHEGEKIYRVERER